MKRLIVLIILLSACCEISAQEPKPEVALSVVFHHHSTRLRGPYKKPLKVFLASYASDSSNVMVIAFPKSGCYNRYAFRNWKQMRVLAKRVESITKSKRNIAFQELETYSTDTLTILCWRRQAYDSMSPASNVPPPHPDLGK